MMVPEELYNFMSKENTSRSRCKFSQKFVLKFDYSKCDNKFKSTRIDSGHFLIRFIFTRINPGRPDTLASIKLNWKILKKYFEETCLMK